MMQKCPCISLRTKWPKKWILMNLCSVHLLQKKIAKFVMAF